MKNLTLLEIANRQRDENLYSDILAFFLNPTKSHGLRITVLKALIETAYQGDAFEEDYRSVYISREFPIDRDTTKPKRIDFFILTKNYVIGIENKIDHILNNPLDIYDQEFLKHAGKDNDQQPIRKIMRIILSAKLIPLDEKYIEVGWKVVTYEDFFKKLKENEILLKSSPYFDYLDQLILSITNNSKKNLNQEPRSAQKSLIDKLESKEWKKWMDSDSDGCSVYYSFVDSNIQVFAYINESSDGWYVGIQLDGKIERGGASLKLFDLLDEKSECLSNYVYIGNGRAGKQREEPYSTDNLDDVVKELLRLKQLVESFTVKNTKILRG